MTSHWNLRAAVAAVLFGSASSLATPVQASIQGCSDLDWNKAILRAAEACQSQASIVADCVDGELVIREIYCY
jgi:hypothetical protein